MLPAPFANRKAMLENTWKWVSFFLPYRPNEHLSYIDAGPMRRILRVESLFLRKGVKELSTILRVLPMILWYLREYNSKNSRQKEKLFLPFCGSFNPWYVLSSASFKELYWPRRDSPPYGLLLLLLLLISSNKNPLLIPQLPLFLVLWFVPTL